MSVFCFCTDHDFSMSNRENRVGKGRQKYGMKIHLWIQRKAHRNTTRNMLKIEGERGTYSYLGSTTVRMDEVNASKRQIIHVTTKIKIKT